MFNIRIIWLAAAALACRPEAAAPSHDTQPIATFTFPERGGLIFLAASLPNRPVELWNLDSGFESSVVSARSADAAGLRTRSRSSTAAPGGAVDQSWIDRVCLGVGGLEFCPDSLARIALDGLEPVVGSAYGGILGDDFFHRFVVRIDYPRRVVSLFDPPTFAPPRSANPVPILLENGEAFLVGTLAVAGRSHPAKLKIDTGSLSFLGLNGSFVAQTALLPPDRRRVPAPGVAIGGKTENWMALIDSLTIAGQTVPRPSVGYSASLERIGDAGTIGAPWLSRFVVTFDYGHRTLWLEPAVPASVPVSSDAAGMLIITPDSAHATLVVAGLSAGGPAARAGLVTGDEIVAIDDRPARELDLFQARRLFEKAGTSFRLTIRRGTTARALTLRTESWP